MRIKAPPLKDKEDAQVEEIENALQPKPRTRKAPKRTKKKETIFKEAMQQGFERVLTTHFREVLEVVVEKAKDGDMSAAKMLLDRVVPVSKAVDLDALDERGGVNIQVNVGRIEEDGITINGDN